MPPLAPPSKIPGTEGYAADAETLISQYESVPFSDKYKAVLHLLPVCASNVLDIGAGTGVDASWFAKQGHSVLAVEPTKAFREAGVALHPSDQIEWLDDSLPDLIETRKRKAKFSLVLVTAVWTHLAEDERHRAMPNVAALLERDGLLIMSLRHGSAPASRRVFEVTAEETRELAQQNGLTISLLRRTESVQVLNRQAGVTWSWLVFRK
jgi:2-polyprenyl-3-methyl-5-hydroxy-6-metoxy-1,4-benzoquinol methylase